MAVSLWGTIATLDTTIESSPTPTNTVFTVTDPTGFQQSMYVEVQVGGVYYRRQISTITSGNIITLATSLPGTPDVPGSCQFKGELLTNDHLNEMVNGINSSLNSAVEITTDTTLSIGTTYIVNASTTVTVTLPTSFNIGQPIRVTSIGTGDYFINPGSGDQINGTTGSVRGLQYSTVDIFGAAADSQWNIANTYPSDSVISVAKGYWGGSAAPSNLISGYNFLSSTAISVSATLSTSRGYVQGVYTPRYGYFCGGSGPSNVIDEFVFGETPSCAAISATLPTARTQFGATQGTAKGFLCGQSGSSTIDKLIFSSKTTASTAMTLSANRQDMGSNCWCETTESGYLGGGLEGVTPVSTIQKIVSTSETISTPAATLAVARRASGGVSSAIRGYWMGGNDVSGTYYTEIDGIIFSSDAATNPAATLATSRQFCSGINSPAVGLVGGGANGGGNLNSINGLVFSGESATTPTATIGTARTGVSSVSQR